MVINMRQVDMLSKVHVDRGGTVLQYPCRIQLNRCAGLGVQGNTAK